MTDERKLLRPGTEDRLINNRFNLRGVSYFPNTKQLSAMIYDNKTESTHHVFREGIEKRPDREEFNRIIKEFIDGTF